MKIQNKGGRGSVIGRDVLQQTFDLFQKEYLQSCRRYREINQIEMNGQQIAMKIHDQKDISVENFFVRLL